MKSKMVWIGIAALSLMAATLWAADITGKWTAQAQGSDITLIFKVAGTALTGTLENSQMPGVIEIKDGKIDGDNVSFTINRKMNDMEMKIVWKGKVEGNVIKFKRETAGGAMGGGMGGPGGGAPAEEIVAKKAQ
jgi:hypothetical protein